MLLERHSLLRLPFDVRRGGWGEREPRMDDARFDEMARGLDTRLTRRHAGGLATGALLALGLAMESDAKKKKKRKRKKKKNKKNQGGGSGGGGGVNISWRQRGRAMREHVGLPMSPEQDQSADLHERRDSTKRHQLPALPVSGKLSGRHVLRSAVQPVCNCVCELGPVCKIITRVGCRRG